LLWVSAAQAQSVTQNQTISFGAFAAGSGGTISVSAAGVRSATGGVTLFTLARLGSPAAGAFAVQAASNANKDFAVALPVSATLSRTGGGTMTVNNFVSVGPGTNVLTGNPRTGSFTLGARLVVGANQLPGVYTGTFNLTVTYQ
jgi:hypothetical protein